MTQGSDVERDVAPQARSQEGQAGPADAVAESHATVLDAQGEADLSAAADDAGQGEDATEGAGEDDATARVAQLEEELAAAQAKADEYLDKLQRSAAEFQNSRRRLETQLADAVDRANAGLISRLLPVLDDLDLAFRNVPPELSETDESGAEVAWLQGFWQIRKKLMDVLSDQGVTPVEAGGEFDPTHHEAISSEPSEEVASGHVIAEVRAGYVYKGRVLRPALVRVAA